jgi:hypothetical protein
MFWPWAFLWAFEISERERECKRGYSPFVFGSFRSLPPIGCLPITRLVLFRASHCVPAAT